MKTFLRRFLIALGGLLVLLALFHLVENVRGRRAWQQWRQAREAAGDNYDVSRLIPPAVPDAENFAMAPLIADAVAGRSREGQPVAPAALSGSKNVGDWRKGQRADLDGLRTELKVTDLKEVLSPFEADLAALAEASRRPHCRLMKNYEKPLHSPVPALTGIRARARILALRALLWLRQGQAEPALEDVFTGLRVAIHLQQEPQLITQLLRNSWVNTMLQPVWEGIQDHRWNEAQLARLQAELAQVDLVASLSKAWQFERLGLVHGLLRATETASYSSQGPLFFPQKKSHLESLLFSALIPKGWVFQNVLRTDQYFVTHFLDVMDPAAHRIRARASQVAKDATIRIKHTPYNHLIPSMPALEGENIRMARTQSGLDMAVIACALERHRLALDQYPEKLADLAPTYLPKAPVDVVEGLPLRYTPQDKDSYHLYSLGWNLTDEGGRLPQGDTKDTPEQGDWVWAKGR